MDGLTGKSVVQYLPSVWNVLSLSEATHCRLPTTDQNLNIPSIFTPLLQGKRVPLKNFQYIDSR